MSHFDKTYSIGGSRYRIILYGNTVSAPYQRWSDYGYNPANNFCTRAWFHERLNGTANLRCGDIENLTEAILKAFVESEGGNQ